MSAYLLPALIAALLIYALFKRVNLYAAFVAGAKDALLLVVNILPYLAAMLIALNAFRSCGVMGALIQALSSPLAAVGMPAELIPLAVLKPFSGSAALGLIADLMQRHGADSFLGFAACVMMGSSETIFYTISLYFGSVGVTKTRYAVAVGLMSALAGVAASLWAAALFWPYP